MEEEFLRDKAAVMDALSAAGITSVVLAFDGNSDDGQIESFEARAGEITVELPTTQVLMLEESADDEKAEHGTAVPLAEAIETLCFEYLEGEYGGWETNEGSYGTFTFNVLDRLIELDFNKRFMDEEKFSERF